MRAGPVRKRFLTETPKTKIIQIVVWNLPGQLITKLEERSYADTDSVESNLSK